MAGSITVKHYRFRNDDGTETTATWKAAEDTQIVQQVTADTNVRLRLKLANDIQAVSAVYGLNVSRNAGAPALVGAASVYVQGVDSTNLTDGAATTAQLTLDATYDYITTNGVADNTSAQSASIVMTAFPPPATETEVEWSLKLIFADLTPGDTLDFTLVRISGGAPSISQFSSSVRITIAAGLDNQDHPLDMGQLVQRLQAASRDVKVPPVLGQDEIKFVLLGEELFDLNLLLRKQADPRSSRSIIFDSNDFPGGAAPGVAYRVLGKWVSVQQANLRCAIRVVATGVFNLNILSAENVDTGPDYVIKQLASTTITVDGATALYTEDAVLDIPWPAVGTIEIFGAAGLSYYADIRFYQKRGQ